MSLPAGYKRFQELDLRPIMFSVVKREDGPRWSVNVARVTAEWYRRFLYLLSLYPDKDLVPTEGVDEFWHYHILDTSKYHVDCEMLFGTYLHHFPYLGLRGAADKQKLAQKFRETLLLFVQHFGDEPASALRRMNAAPELSEAGPAVCAGACAGTVAAWKQERPILSEES